jgi:hypothetical protein
MESWQNAQAFVFIHTLKERLWDVARPIQIDEPIPEGVYVVKQKATPVPNLQRRTMQPAATDDAMDAIDALDARDVEKMRNVLQDYVNDVLMDATQAEIQRAQMIAGERFMSDFRVIDKRVVDAMFRPLRGGASGVGAIADAATTLARWSLIYSNPAYIPINFIGNTFFLLAQQGPKAVSNLISASKMLFGDSDFAIRVAAEAGELPSTAAISRGRGYSRRAREVETKALNIITTLPDKLPRMAAWVYEAQRMGYKTKADMLRLIEGKTARDARNRETIANRATEIMVNFDRMSDWERQSVTRVLFIWPWIRGATAWPFYYAKEFPVQTAAAAELGQSAEQRRQRIMEANGDIPLYRKDLLPLGEPEGGHVSAINLGPISPTSTAAQSLETLRANIMSLLGKEQLTAGQRLLDMLQPVWETGIGIATGQTGFGQATTSLDLLKEGGMSFIPQGSAIQQLYDPSKVSKANVDKSRWGVLSRRLGRLSPQEVSIPWMNAQAQKRGQAKTPQQTIDLTVEKEQEALKMAAPTMVYSQEMRRAVIRRTLFVQKEHDVQAAKAKKGLWQPVQDEKGTWKTKPDLTPWEQAQIAFALEKQYPVTGKPHIPPEQVLVLGDKRVSPDSALGREALTDYVRDFHSDAAPPSDSLKKQKQDARAAAEARRLRAAG